MGAGTAIWDLTQVRSAASIGEYCVVGRNVFVDAGVVVGSRCKIQNNALLYAPAQLGDGVFVGPAAVLTNDRYPRAVDTDGHLKGEQDWTPQGVVIADGASVGAAAVVLGGVHVGHWALVAANAVVTKDVPAYGLMAGSPARRVGWVGPSGRRLRPTRGSTWECPATKATFVEVGADELAAQ